MSLPPPDTTTYILGAGAMGCLWASHARKNGASMPLILRDQLRLTAYVSGPGIQLEHRNGLSEIVPATALSPDQLERPIKQLLVCTKAQQTRQAVANLGKMIQDDAVFILLQNGFGAADELRQMYPLAPIYQASTTEGAFRRDAFHIVHAGRGETMMGPVAGTTIDETRTLTLAAQLSHGPLSVTYRQDIDTVLWRKLAINCAINPLSVKYRCRNGELLDNAVACQDMFRIVDEIALLSDAMGRADWIPDLLQQVRDVARATALNRSSMLQDVEAGRATEVAYINGYLRKLAEHHGLDLPFNAQLLDMVLATHPTP